jgi:hypothetical protein
MTLYTCVNHSFCKMHFCQRHTNNVIDPQTQADAWLDRQLNKQSNGQRHRQTCRHAFESFLVYQEKSLVALSYTVCNSVALSMTHTHCV